MAAIFLHHRDLRHVDNIGLTAACKAYAKVYPVFIFTPEQTTAANKYLNQNSIAFMKAALLGLRVSTYRGDTIAVLRRLVKAHGIDAVFENADYSPYAKRRQRKVAALCHELGIEYSLHEDVLLHPMGAILKANGTAYVKFTPFYNAAQHLQVPKPRSVVMKTALLPDRLDFKGRPLTLPSRVNLRDYEHARDHPAFETSRLSAHLHFGTISPRKVYWSYPPLRRQLYWREFYAYIVNYVNTDYSKLSVTRPLLNRIKWTRPGAGFRAWKEGRTGVPIVDAGMRQLLEEGYMHNRCRMIVAMYLIFHLGHHWSHGEQFFAQHLVDYDYANNLGGWLWCAGVEVHSNEYYRAFAMPAQSKKCDPDAEYILRWVPELAGVPVAHIHNWHEHWREHRTYVRPVVEDLAEARKHTIDLYKRALSGR